MSDIIINAENLGKKYLIGHQSNRGSYTTLRDVLAQNACGILRKTKDLFQGKPIIKGDTVEEFWALKNINFKIHKGEAVGIIGRNGAGKSTLLKVLSRITEPSAGRVTIKGRVASLLEVGTGFHPELTGRENIYLNGAILGMTRRETKKRFDEIVTFAGIEKFLDTPVKRYSSGMYVRLAFAVAAHLEPEILVVDEVLSVGDTQFQKKCLGKMNEVAKSGRTILFVSHNMAAITALCNRCIALEDGGIIMDGTVREAIDCYLGRNKNVGELQENLSSSKYIKSCYVSTETCYNTMVVHSGENIFVNMLCALSDISSNYHVAFDFYNHHGIRVFYCNSSIVTGDQFSNISGSVLIRCNIEKLPLMPGQYFMRASLHCNYERIEMIENAAAFQVVGGDFWGSGKFVTGTNPPLMLVDHTWSMKKMEM